MQKEVEYENLKNECLKESEEPIVFGEGRLDAKIVLIGEAPGAKEIEMRKPFVGQAGKNLDEFLEIVEISRDDIYITNVVKIRPYRINKKTGRKINRAPNKREIDKYSKYLFKELEIIKPKLIVTLGNVPLKTLLNDFDAKISNLHGQVYNISNRIIFPLYHPAAVIYNRSLRGTYLEDLNRLKKYIKEKGIIK
ncbi:DNA polymerase [Caminicella sporogenes DSM 14501]|uniref:Type-4 uracil-DNA glycosylase n=1 Tax=Caminicella sporogenes DSM 14501 TaxID=1121266 RepID=A0A1M6NBC9_9FIRM|nr:uracil-DNA glycosylase [Caminicella sporogenes]RKD22259.1 uracil-DNA glycosylase [Caminicella sporogenes]SHJ93001.1 DNA polymerase [Caminicella sporogenes DSM 14501]